MIYAILQGRLGNQLFIYAMAEAVRISRGKNEKVCLCTHELDKQNIAVSIKKLNFEDTTYISDFRSSMPVVSRIILSFYRRKMVSQDKIKTAKNEKKFEKIFNNFGIIAIENGYLDYQIPTTKDVYLVGYFQSAKYFENILSQKPVHLGCFPHFSKQIYSLSKEIERKNSVSVHIRRGDYTDIKNTKFATCSYEYYQRAIEYFRNTIPCPHFFIFSDDSQYVAEYFEIDANITFIPENINDIETIYLMSHCKNYILSNSSFGWWGQYMCSYKEKMVVAPNRWYADDTPCDIMQESWTIL